MTIFLVTRDDDDWGYICQSEDTLSFLACLQDVENETQIRFVKHMEDDGLFYLVEQRLGDSLEWDVHIIGESDDSLDEDVLYLVEKEIYLEKA